MAKGIFFTAITAFLIAFAFKNFNRVPLSFVFGNPVSVNLTYIIVISFILGLLASVIAGVIIKSRKNRYDQ